jgi:hypothetical protein
MKLNKREWNALEASVATQKARDELNRMNAIEYIAWKPLTERQRDRLVKLLEEHDDDAAAILAAAERAE